MVQGGTAAQPEVLHLPAATRGPAAGDRRRWPCRGRGRCGREHRRRRRLGAGTLRLAAAHRDPDGTTRPRCCLDRWGLHFFLPSRDITFCPFCQLWFFESALGKFFGWFERDSFRIRCVNIEDFLTCKQTNAGVACGLFSFEQREVVWERKVYFILFLAPLMLSGLRGIILIGPKWLFSQSVEFLEYYNRYFEFNIMYGWIIYWHTRKLIKIHYD